MRSIAKIVIRLFSISMLVRFIQYAQIFIFPFSDIRSNLLSFISNIFQMLLILVIGWVLWIKADKIASKIIEDDKTVNIKVNIQTLQIAAFSVVGIFILVNALPLIISNIFNIYAFSKITNGASAFESNSKSMAILIENVVKTILGIWLMFGSKSIVSLINKIRTVGLDNKENNELEIEDTKED